MKKYMEPKTQQIKLDPEQAILEVCVLGGGYFWRPAHRTWCNTSELRGGWCNKSVRGRSLPTSAGSVEETSAFPS